MSKVEAAIVRPQQKEAVQPKQELKTLKDLIFLGRIEKKINISGFEIGLKSLTIQDNKYIIEKILLSDNASKFVDAKILSIVTHINTINEVPVENLCEDESITNPMDRKLNVVSNFQLSLIEKLYEFCNKIDEESGKEVEVNEIKK